MSAQAADKLAEALIATRIVEPVTKTHKDGAIELLCRVNAEHHERWLKLIDAVKVAEERDATQPYKWRSRIFLEYFRKDGQLVKGWVFYLQSNMLLDALEVIASTLRLGKTQPALGKKVVELTEMEMTGLPPNYDRNKPSPARNSDGSLKLDNEGRPIMGRHAREVKGGM